MAKPTRDELRNRIEIPENQIFDKGADSSPINSNGEFHAFAEQSPNMIFINSGGRIVYANKRCIEIMGYTREDFNNPAFDFMTLIAPESIDLIRTNFERHMAGEDIEPYEYSLINRRGEKIEAIITTRLINYENNLAILGIITDITGRKRAEEELQYRLKFQHLITTVSSQFINLHPAQIDDEIDHTLKQIGEFADADRSYVFQFSDDQKAVSCTHEWCANQIAPAIERIQNVSVDNFPWILKKHLRGEMTLIPRVSELPPEAARERRNLSNRAFGRFWPCR